MFDELKKFLIRCFHLDNLEKLQNINQLLLEKNKKLEKENDYLHDNNRKLVEKYNHVSSDSQKMQSENFNMIAEINTLRVKERQYREQFNTIFNEYNKVTLDNTRKEENTKSLERKIVALNNTIKDQRNTIEGLTKQINNLYSDKMILEATIRNKNF